MNDELIDRLAKLEYQYPKRSPEAVAEAMLHGWAFTGTTIEQHNQDVKRIADRVREIRKGKAIP